MEGLLTLLLFAGLFYFMMRFGCGAHAVHGHGGGGQGGHAGHGGQSGHDEHGGRQDITGAIDPVFGLLLSPLLAAIAMSFSSVTVFANANRLKRWSARAV